jgi:hypothetical protein
MSQQGDSGWLGRAAMNTLVATSYRRNVIDSGMRSRAARLCAWIFCWNGFAHESSMPGNVSLQGLLGKQFFN